MMLKIDREILDIDNVICENIELIDFTKISRGFIAQNLLAQSRNLVEHVAVKIYGQGKDIEADWQTIPAALEYWRRNNKYLFLRQFHQFLQESKSHYTPDDEGAERLILKYYRYYLLLRNFMEKECGFEILHNLEKFPCDTDKSVSEYHKKIAEKVDIPRYIRDFGHEPRMYVHKVAPFSVNGKVYYEIILTPAYDTTSKFDRFVCYSSIMVPSHYSLKADIYHEDIYIHEKRMPIDILSDFTVSIRPCELNNYASLFGAEIKMSASHAEYIGMMEYLSTSGASLLEIVLSSSAEYKWIKAKMFGRSQVHYFEDVLDKSRELILLKKPGANVIRYLLHTLNNKIIKTQRNDNPNWKLSDLYLKWGCIPFDEMPFATSLIQHNPENRNLYESISADGREHEQLARYIHANMSTNSRLYTPIKEIEAYTNNIEPRVDTFNSRLYSGHKGRRIEKFGQSLYVKEAFDQTKSIITKLQETSENRLEGYSDAIDTWLEDSNVDSEEKRQILRGMFAKSRLALIYGAAGTGKTYIINHISQFFDERKKLYLANTNPAVENLRRKVNAQNCEFMTIRKYLMSKYVDTEYDLLIIDECSMVSNADMSKVLEKVQYKLLILVGDTYQIESIVFGNWFSMARYFVPRYAWSALEKPYRTNDEGLLEFWKKVRNLDSDLTEYIVNHHYASNLNSSIFDRQSEDEIILCLNYDGLYGINNINRFLQENNPHPAVRWGMWTFKVGDPVLFNESERFMPVLYNNLKGTIINIELDDKNENIWFSIEIEKALTELDIMDQELELLDPLNPGKSVIRFRVRKKKDSDDDNDFAGDTDIPFQIAYAVSIHKAQGLEYDSVKVIITKEVDEMISHNIFYTAITRSKKHLMIYWSPETQHKILENFEIMDVKRDATIFAAQSKLKIRKG